jgi:arabinosyltransferase B
MAFAAAVLFVMALCFATTNGWWYVSSYGVPFNNDMPTIAGIKVSTIFFVLFVIAAVWAFWLHFNQSHPESRAVRMITAAPIPVAAGFMVVVFVASMAIGAVREYPTYSNLAGNLRALGGGCGLADNVLVEPDPNTGFLTPLPGDYGPLGPLGGTGSVGFTPNGVPDHIVAEAIRLEYPVSGTDSDWDAAVKLKTPGINGSTVPLPYGLDPARVPMAGTYTEGPHQPSKLTSAWYALPPANAAHPLVVVTAAGTITGNSVLNGHTEAQKVALEYGRPGPGGAPVAAGRLTPYDLGPAPSWRNLRYDRRQIPADSTYVRVVGENLSLNLGDWIAVTPPRVPELQTVQEYLGKTQPVLMDWAVGLAFPCQQPMLVHNGVTEVPKFRITPDYTAKKQDTDTWQDGINGGLLGITDVLLRAHVMATYLSDDWGRDWGSLRRFTTIVDAVPAQLELGTATHSGLYSPGKMRIEP